LLLTGDKGEEDPENGVNCKEDDAYEPLEVALELKESLSALTRLFFL
jgi:hypothetical protein